MFPWDVNKMYLVWDWFGQHKLRYNSCLRRHGRVLVNPSEIQFFSSHEWEWFGQHRLMRIFYPHWHGWDLVYTSCVTFCVIAGIWAVWSTQVEVHFVSLLAFGGFVQHKMRVILCPRCHGMGLVNTSWEAFCVFVGILRFWSTQVELQFCIRWHGRGLVNTRWDIFCDFAGMGGVWATQFQINFGMGWVSYMPVKMHFVSSLAWDVLINHYAIY